MLANKLVKDFKSSQIEIEDYLIENVSDIVAEFADRKGQEHYNLINELCDMMVLLIHMKEKLKN